jgi:hypothetical protein
MQWGSAKCFKPLLTIECLVPARANLGELHYDPVPASTTPMVRSRIFRSSQMLQLST